MTVGKEDDHDQRCDDSRLLPFAREQSEGEPDQRRAKKRQQDRPHKRRRIHVRDVEVPQFEDGIKREEKGMQIGECLFHASDVL